MLTTAIKLIKAHTKRARAQAELFDAQAEVHTAMAAAARTRAAGEFFATVFNTTRAFWDLLDRFMAVPKAPAPAAPAAPAPAAP